MQDISSGTSGDITGSTGEAAQTSQSLQEEFARRLQQNATGLHKTVVASALLTDGQRMFHQTALMPARHHCVACFMYLTHR